MTRLDPLFQGLRRSVSPLVRLILESGITPSDDWVHGVKWPIESQEMLSQKVSEAIGFDFNSGRRDSSIHPFCGGPNPQDVRWTTHLDMMSRSHSGLCSDQCTKPAMGRTSKGGQRLWPINPQGKRVAWESTKASLGCGKTKLAARYHFANGSFPFGRIISQGDSRMSPQRCFGGV